ncbi:MAG TPA: BglII/BstYI family type II restriction endonuclease [Verrucomicrobiae bacterium]|nr:BglII/BstYI family type II restriction endonuclease [Verrucomicrobiae bacterium]
MKIVQAYSHLNGLEYLSIRKKRLWKEVQDVIKAVDGNACKTKVSREKAKTGKILFSPIGMNQTFCDLLRKKNWLIRQTMTKSAEEQKAEIEAAGEKAIFSYNQTDFVKDRVAIEVQFGKYSFVAYDLFAKHLAFYVRDHIDVGIEILAMKSLQSEMSSGPAYFEGELYNIVRNGRGVPAVPLVLIGVEP